MERGAQVAPSHLKEKRDERSGLQARIQILNQRVKGLLTREDGKYQQTFLVFDVSEDGIGIWSPEALIKGESVTLTVGTPYLLILSCNVNWCERFAKTGGYRSGLTVIASSKSTVRSLLKAFNDAQILKTERVS
jgi:hypothetical protein